jgi:hypothetical protein
LDFVEYALERASRRISTSIVLWPSRRASSAPAPRACAAPSCRPPARPIPRCNSSLTNHRDSAGRHPMPPGSRRHRLSRLKALLDGAQLLLGRPMPTARHSRDQLDLLILL